VAVRRRVLPVRYPVSGGRHTYAHGQVLPPWLQRPRGGYLPLPRLLSRPRRRRLQRRQRPRLRRNVMRAVTKSVNKYTSTQMLTPFN
jgi:hypothetical protein